MKLIRMLFFLSATVIAATGVANATTITYSTGFGLAQPDWLTTLLLPKFNSSLGTLTSVTLTNKGDIVGSIGVENKHATLTRIITATLSAELDVTLPGALGTLSSTPTATQSFSLPKFDGTIDFAGTSGKTINGLTASDTQFYTTNPFDLALFIGSGNLSFVTSATDASFATGGGNTASNFSNAAGIKLDVQYDYTPTTVPEPSTMLLIGLGLAGLGLGKMRFARKK